MSGKRTFEAPRPTSIRIVPVVLGDDEGSRPSSTFGAPRSSRPPRDGCPNCAMSSGCVVGQDQPTRICEAFARLELLQLVLERGTAGSP